MTGMTGVTERAGRRGRTLPLWVATLVLAAIPQLTLAEESWNPFAERQTYRSPPPPGNATGNRGAGDAGDGAATRYGNAPFPGAGQPGYSQPLPQDRTAGPGVPQGGYTPPPASGATTFSPAASQVERGELAPVMSSGSGLPFGSWQGMTASDVEQLVAPLELPARSRALQSLWLRILTSQDAPADSAELTSLRAEALYRSGRLSEARALLATPPRQPQAATAVVDLLTARIELALAGTDSGCRAAKAAGRNKSSLPRALRGEAIILAGYCAILAGNKAGAGLAAELARNEGYRKRFTLTILDAIASNRESRSVLPDSVGTTDYVLLKQAGFDQDIKLIPKAEPALLSLLLDNADLPAATRIAAAEEAARRNVIDGAKLAEIYRQYRGPAPSDAAAARLELARLFQSAENTPTPLRRARYLRQLIDTANRAGLGIPVMVAVKPIVDQIRPAPEISWFALTAIEVVLAAGDYDSVLPWLALSQASDGVFNENLGHWRIIADLANPAARGHATDLTALEPLVARDRFRGQALRRLTAVLDALNYNVPITVWDAANRTSAKAAGKLPPTGVLSQLLAASKAKETARTALLAMRAINGSTATSAHLIALGDAIRGLKRAGLEKDARRLAFEAVFDSWPRPDRY